MALEKKSKVGLWSVLTGLWTIIWAMANFWYFNVYLPSNDERFWQDSLELKRYGDMTISNGKIVIPIEVTLKVNNISKRKFSIASAYFEVYADKIKTLNRVVNENKLKDVMSVKSEYYNDAYSRYYPDRDSCRIYAMRVMDDTSFDINEGYVHKYIIYIPEGAYDIIEACLYVYGGDYNDQVKMGFDYNKGELDPYFIDNGKKVSINEGDAYKEYALRHNIGKSTKNDIMVIQ